MTRKTCSPILDMNLLRDNSKSKCVGQPEFHYSIGIPNLIMDAITIALLMPYLFRLRMP
jgi:hypothetical protein